MSEKHAFKQKYSSCNCKECIGIMSQHRFCLDTWILKEYHFGDWKGMYAEVEKKYTVIANRKLKLLTLP